MSDERPRGIIGERYTRTTDFDGSIEGYRLATPEEIVKAGGTTPYQKAVAKHMADAPEDLRDYVCGRLVESDNWMENICAILNCGFAWMDSKEGGWFWAFISDKDWQEAMETDFWKSRQQQPTAQVTEQPTKPSKEAKEFWGRAFSALSTDSTLSMKQCAWLADQAMAEWQKRFEP